MSNYFTRKSKFKYAVFVALFAVFVTVWSSRSLSQDATKEIQTHIQNYVALHKKASASVPSKPKDVTDATVLAKHEQQLAQAIRALRPDAKRGDIFTPEVQKTLTAIIQMKLDKNARATILGEGNPKSEESPAPINLAVNATYPTSAPVSTMPPSLLMALPTLPAEVEFRFVGRTLILRDVQANMIVDFMPNAL